MEFCHVATCFSFLIIITSFRLCNLLSCYSIGIFEQSLHSFSWYINHALMFFNYANSERLLWQIHGTHHLVYHKSSWTMFYVGHKSLWLMLISYSGMQVGLLVQKKKKTRLKWSICRFTDKPTCIPSINQYCFYSVTFCRNKYVEIFFPFTGQKWL
jgi:hypothetical protein